MELPNGLKRLLVWLLRVKPKVLTEAEKAVWREKTIETNRKQDRNIMTCPDTLISGLSIESVALPESSGWLVKKDGNPDDVIIYYIHGGGFVGACTKDRMRFVSCLVKEFGYNVFSVDYRLAPEYMQPCQLLDCLDGYTYLMKSYSPEKILLIGESAGGTLVLTLPVLLRDRGLPLPKAIYSNSPATQLADYTDSYRRFSLKEDFIVTEGIIENMRGVYLNREDEKDPYVSPLYADLKDLPPVFLTASECECLLDDSLMMYEKLKEAGNEARLKTYPGLCHAFIISPQMKKVVRDAYPDLRQYLCEHLK